MSRTELLAPAGNLNNLKGNSVFLSGLCEQVPRAFPSCVLQDKDFHFFLLL